MADKEKFYITTAIAYTSRKPHIGNSYEIVLTDAIARFKRLQGYDVFMLTGTDEHGQKIEEYAKSAGVTPKEYVDKVSGEIRSICDLLNTSYDKFIRTTDEYHEKTVQKIFKKLYDQGDIYKGHYEGMYCTPCESFWTESQLVAPTAAERLSLPKRRHISLDFQNIKNSLKISSKATKTSFTPRHAKRKCSTTSLSPDFRTFA